MDCKDCFHSSRCEVLIGPERDKTHCDWSPSKYISQDTAKARRESEEYYVNKEAPDA